MAPDSASEAVEGLDVVVADGVLRLRFARPEVLNALTPAMVLAASQRLERASADDAVRAVLLTGSGGSFSAGADIGADARGPGAHERFDVRAMDLANRLVRAVIACNRPVVAAVEGMAAGVACGAALACDLVVAHPSASFLLPFTRIGFMPDGGTTASVAASVGRARAMRMALLAEPLTAAEAYAAGLVSHLTTDADHAAVVEKVLRRLVAGPPLAQTATKRAVNAATLAHLDAALERERTGQTLLMRSDDVAEGMSAFNERRRPVFRGE